MNQEEFNRRVKIFLTQTVEDDKTPPLVFEEASTLLSALEMIENE